MGVNPNIGSDFVVNEPCGFMYHRIQKKEVERLPFLGAQWDSSLKLSDFVDYEPWVRFTTVHKKETSSKSLFGCPVGFLR